MNEKNSQGEKKEKKRKENTQIIKSTHVLVEKHTGTKWAIIQFSEDLDFKFENTLLPRPKNKPPDEECTQADLGY